MAEISRHWCPSKKWCRSPSRARSVSTSSSRSARPRWRTSRRCKRACRITSIAQAKDFVRLHPDEENYWSSELCFVNVPIKGQKRDTLHLIDEDLAMQYLPSGKI